MKEIVEIRWHGRGGQGAKTASLLLADAAFNTGKYAPGLPEYGPERRARRSPPITGSAANAVRCIPIFTSRIMWSSWMKRCFPRWTCKRPERRRGHRHQQREIPRRASAFSSKGYRGRVCTIDAGRISEETLGKNFPTPHAGGDRKGLRHFGGEGVYQRHENSFQHKFASKPQVIEAIYRR